MPQGRQSSSSESDSDSDGKNVKMHDEDEDMSSNDGESSTHNQSTDNGELSWSMVDEMLNQMDACCRSESYRAFDFSQISIGGMTPDTVRQHYLNLRKQALKYSKLKDEVALVRSWVARKRAGSLPGGLRNDRPKRPVTAFILFCEEERKKLYKKQPSLSRSVRTYVPILAQRWKNISEEKRRPYVLGAEKDKQRYIKAMEEYRKKHPKEKKIRTQKVTLKTAFEIFSAAKQEAFAEKFKIEGAALKKKLGEKFQLLPDKKREKWEQKAKAMEEAFLNRLAHTKPTKAKPKQSKQGKQSPGKSSTSVKSGASTSPKKSAEASWMSGDY